MDGRERIAELLDAVVTRARVLLDGGGIPPAEASNAMMFYVLADHLLSTAKAADQPMNPAALAGGLRQLQARCAGALADQRSRIQDALDEAENVDWEFRIA
jgi:hypothetical protein